MTDPGDFFDARETRDPATRETALMAALAQQIAHAKAHAPAYGEILADVDPAMVTDRTALARLPVTRKADLVKLQAAAPPLGGLATIAPSAAARLFTSPGPIYEPEGPRPDYWRAARALYAAGFRRGDIVHNAFSYHLTPGGWILDSGLRALGCAVVPAGVGNTEAQVRAIAHLRPAGYTGTPDFLKVLLDKGLELDLDCGSLNRALVSGGALFPALRAEYADRGVRVLQCYATADLGVIAYESIPDAGLIVDEDLIVEIVRPGTGDPVPDGEVGEVVVTTLNPDYPLIRFATGDLSAVLPGASPCGRTNVRLKGWMGRADQTTKIKGMFVHPAQIAAVLARHPEVARARLVVTRDGPADVMTLRCALAPDTQVDAQALSDALAVTLREVTKLKGSVVIVAPEDLPNDGKVIEDARSYD
ncbi:MAG: phenylacetate--CoA ligase family protein [Alphaproteobacteria bacterium]|nr:MAG: phenylacetate--CoA ligase family protein [Alphaproteobacteria bacterium]